MKYTYPILVLLTLVSCSTTPDSTKSNLPADPALAEKEIRELTDHFGLAHILKDTAFLNHIFTEDARVLGPNTEAVVGRKAIAEVNNEWVNYGIHEFREESTHFYGEGNFLVDEGNYYLMYGEDSVRDRGKYINVWKNVDGEWKMYSNIWNTSLPFE